MRVSITSVLLCLFTLCTVGCDDDAPPTEEDMGGMDTDVEMDGDVAPDAPDMMTKRELPSRMMDDPSTLEECNDDDDCWGPDAFCFKQTDALDGDLNACTYENAICTIGAGKHGAGFCFYRRPGPGHVCAPGLWCTDGTFDGLTERCPIENPATVPCNISDNGVETFTHCDGYTWTYCSEPENDARTCSDGRDNDYDGLTDSADPDCP